MPPTDTTPHPPTDTPPSEEPTPATSWPPNSASPSTEAPSSPPSKPPEPPAFPRLGGLFGAALAHCRLDPTLEDLPPQRYAADPECPNCRGHGFLTERVQEDPHGASLPYWNRVVPCPCSEARNRAQRIARLFGRAQFPGEFLEPGQDSFTTYARRAEGDQRARALVEHWAEHGEGGLYLWGEQGRGKTGLAVCALRHRVEMHGVDVLYRYVPELLDDIRAGFDRELGGLSSGEIARTIREAGLLLLDDLGKENLTPWVRETFNKLIDYRWREHRPTIFTSNFPLEDLKARMDAPFHSRVKAMCWPNVLEVRGDDLREGA